MYANAVLVLVISTFTLDAQATWQDTVARAWEHAERNHPELESIGDHIAELEDSPGCRSMAERLAEWNRTVWNNSMWEGMVERMAEWNTTMWNNSEWRSIADRIAEWNRTTWDNAEWEIVAARIAEKEEDSPEWRGIAERMAEWNKTVWNNSMWQSLAERMAELNKSVWNNSDWNSIAERITQWNTTVWNSSGVEMITDLIAEWEETRMRNHRGGGRGRGRGRGRGEGREGDRGGRGRGGRGRGDEEPESVSGAMALVVSDAAAFAADPEAEHVVRAALADLASIEEDSIVALTLTAAADNSRRLTAAPEEGAVIVRYVIGGLRDSSESSRIAAVLRTRSASEVARACHARVQAAGLPYAVNRARITSVALRRHEREEPCEEPREGEGSLRGSHGRGNCGPPRGSGGPDEQGNKWALLVGISVGGSLLCLALCVCVTACVCRSLTKAQGPKVVHIVEGAPCKGNNAKGAPPPAQGAVVDNNNNTDSNNTNTNNGIVVGVVVTEPHKEGSLAYV